MGQRVAIATIGTTGDVQPFVALALELNKLGHSVVIGTTSDFREFVTSRGVEFHDLGGNIQNFLRQSQFDQAMTKSGLIHAPSLLRQGQRIIEAAARQVWLMAQGADAIVFNTNTSFAIDVAEALNIPSIMTALWPVNPTDEFPYFLSYAGSSLGPTLNRLSYVVMSAQQGYFDLPRNRLRDTLLGLRPKRFRRFGFDDKGNALPTLHAYSEHLSPRPADWPADAVVTGFWRLDDDTGWEPDADFRRFLDAGDPPIYLGFGSMPFGAKRNTEIITRAVNEWGGRAVIARGWGGFNAATLPKSIHALSKAPHTKLFQHVKAVVHHGGAGTTYAGLYAGRPTFIAPQFFDQPFWGHRVHELGCGPAPVKLRKLTAEILAGALYDLDTNEDYRLAATELQQKLVAENGTERAVEAIEEAIAAHTSDKIGQLAVQERALDRSL